MNEAKNIQNTTEQAVNYTDLLAEVNYSAVSTWLEPYIGFKFKIIKKGKKTTKVNWWGTVKTIGNNRFNFCNRNIKCCEISYKTVLLSQP